MNRWAFQQARPLNYVPRRSGDEPSIPNLGEQGIECSPQERGLNEYTNGLVREL